MIIWLPFQFKIVIIIIIMFMDGLQSIIIRYNNPSILPSFHPSIHPSILLIAFYLDILFIFIKLFLLIQIKFSNFLNNSSSFGLVFFSIINNNNLPTYCKETNKTCFCCSSIGHHLLFIIYHWSNPMIID